MFPEGLVGAGLLLLRISCALATGATLHLLAPLPLWAETGLVVLAGSLLCGLLTRLAAIAGAALQVVVVFTIGGSLGWIAALIALDLVGLSMTGPGAYSIDARLFGRRVITLDPPEGEERGE